MSFESAMQFTVVAIWIFGALCALGGLVWLALAIWGRQIIAGIHRNMQLSEVLAREARHLKARQRAAAQKEST